MAALVSLLCLLLPFAAAGMALLVPSAVDLVRRDERVPVWWAIPLLLWLPFLPFAVGIPMVEDAGVERASTSAALWATTWMAAAGNLVVAAMALALPRGLRPEGPTERRFRTTVAAVLLLGTGSIAIPLGVPFVEEALGLMWFVPAAWGGLFWVLLLNRRGPPRLEAGRRITATWLLAAGGLFAVGVLHGARTLSLQRDLEPLLAGLAVAALLGTAALMGSLRALSGPLEPVTLGVASLSLLTLGIPELYWWTFRPLPAGLEAPEWRDLRGESVPEGIYPLRSFRCALEVDTQRFHGPCESFWREYPSTLATPQTRARATARDQELLVGDGTWVFSVPSVEERASWDVALQPDGTLVVHGAPQPDRERAHHAIRALGWTTVYVLDTPDLTIQMFLEVCASSQSHHCILVDAPPPPPDPVEQIPPGLLERWIEQAAPLDPHALDGLFDTDVITVGTP